MYIKFLPALIFAMLLSCGAFSQALTSSNLPIVVINTGGQQIPDEPKLAGTMGIIYNGVGVRNNVTDPYNNYNGNIGIERRGSSSGSFPQKSYAIETRDAAGVQFDTPILGMPAEHCWVLYAPYDDKTCLRNVLTYKIGTEMGAWAPRTVLCEVIINGSYEGIYVMMEKVKRDKNRVNIATLDSNDVAGDSLTGGYIVKIDKTTGVWTGGWNSTFQTGVYYQYHYPDGIAIQPQQSAYIQAYIDSFETAVYSPTYADTAIGYKKYIKVGSFIDYMLVDEISKNVDGYRLSSYLYKDKKSKGGKLVAGPLWDFNLAWWNADYCQGNVVTGWMWDFSQVCPGGYEVPNWWARLVTDTNYANRMRCRYDWLRTKTFDISYLDNFLDSMANYLDEAQQRHFQRWPILGAYTWPNPSPIPTTYKGEIDALKAWIGDRLLWMDQNLPGTCYSVGLDENDKKMEADLSIFPNPATSDVHLRYTLSARSRVTVSLVNTIGETVKTFDLGEQSTGSHQETIDGLGSLPAGMYLLKFASNQNTFSKTIVKID